MLLNLYKEIKMKSKLLILPALSIMLVGCEQHVTNPPPPKSPTQQNSSILDAAPSETNTNRNLQDRRASDDADNTSRNVRDRIEGALTPFDQSESVGDRITLQSIRKALVENKILSTYAKNIKVITANGVVTLRGPVNSAAEKEAIERIVSLIPGVTKVDNQLEVLQNAEK
ncbi:putative hyperosmoticaLLy inducible periplasmic protein [Parachlamydia acanthamoebae]|nr:putative hyperosmoticaLLy inducible periplasmic protein [Parachlamydia acanthamoebae]